MKILEKHLYKRIREFLESKGFKVFYEVPICKLSRARVDVIGFREYDCNVVAVEVKLRNYRRALYQALLRSTFADYVFIAFPERYAKRVYTNYASELYTYHVGLISIGRRVRVLVQPEKSPLLDESSKMYIVAMIMKDLMRE